MACTTSAACRHALQAAKRTGNAVPHRHFQRFSVHLIRTRGQDELGERRQRLVHLVDPALQLRGVHIAERRTLQQRRHAV